jgi:hypothetical protein
MEKWQESKSEIVIFREEREEDCGRKRTDCGRKRTSCGRILRTGRIVRTGRILRAGNELWQEAARKERGESAVAGMLREKSEWLRGVAGKRRKVSWKVKKGHSSIYREQKS